MSDSVGFWGPPSSAIDWCEANYTKHHMIAEFWNTLSSIPLSLVAALGLHFAHKYRYPLRIVISYVLLFVVGVGSTAFHGTLTRWGQALDELSMLCTVTALFYSILDEDDLRRFPRFFVPLAWVIFDLLLGLVYWWVPFYFQYFLSVYVFIIGALCRRSYVIAFHHQPQQHDSAAAISPYHRLWLQRLVKLALGAYLGGSLAFWIPERVVLCVPDGYLQLHALFHITSALGAYSFIVFATLFHYLTLAQRFRQDQHQSNPKSDSSSSSPSSSTSSNQEAPFIITIETVVHPLYSVHVKQSVS